MAKGINSLGKCTIFKTGLAKLIIKSKTPELLNAPIATNSPINVGNMLKVVSIPSFTPSKKYQKLYFFLLLHILQ